MRTVLRVLARWSGETGGAKRLTGVDGGAGGMDLEPDAEPEGSLYGMSGGECGGNGKGNGSKEFAPLIL